MSSNIRLRPAQRSDTSTLARITNAANARSVLHKRIACFQDQYPADYYQWRLHIVRERFATPDLRTIVAEDTSSGKVVGLASYAVEGSDTNLHKRWVGESNWTDWIERNLIWFEKTWFRYVVNKSIDYTFLNKFLAAFVGDDKLARPSCIHCHLIVVDPSTQSRGVGRQLIDWGKDLAAKEELPLFLEANLEAPGFYDKVGFSRMSYDVVVGVDGEEPFRVPAFVWEGPDREGRWLEQDVDAADGGKRWKWKASVLLK